MSFLEDQANKHFYVVESNSLHDGYPCLVQGKTSTLIENISQFTEERGGKLAVGAPGEEKFEYGCRLRTVGDVQDFVAKFGPTVDYIVRPACEEFAAEMLKDNPAQVVPHLYLGTFRWRILVSDPVAAEAWLLDNFGGNCDQACLVGEWLYTADDEAMSAKIALHDVTVLCRKAVLAHEVGINDQRIAERGHWCATIYKPAIRRSLPILLDATAGPGRWQIWDDEKGTRKIWFTDLDSACAFRNRLEPHALIDFEFASDSRLAWPAPSSPTEYRVQYVQVVGQLTRGEEHYRLFGRPLGVEAFRSYIETRLRYHFRARADGIDIVLITTDPDAAARLELCEEVILV